MRIKYSIKNTVTNFIAHIISFIIAFVSQRIFLKLLNIEYLGLNNLFLNIFTVLSLFDLGIVNAIIFSLYKPVASNDKEKIKSLVKFYKKTYLVIMSVIFVVGLLLIPFLKIIINMKGVNIDTNIYIVYFIFLLNSILSYQSMDKKCVIYAYQRYYIYNIVHLIETIVLNIVRLSLLYFTSNYYLYISISTVCIIIENIVINYITIREYPFLLEKNIKPLNKKTLVEIKDKVKSLFIHKISSVIINGTDSIIISSFLGLTTVGLYASYSYIINALYTLFGNTILSNSSSVGNLLVEKNKEKNYQTYRKIIFLNFWLTVFTSTCLLLLTEPFITLWIGDKYLLPTSVLIVLVINYFQQMMRSTFIVFKDGAGIWIEDKFVPLIESLINLTSSIILIKLIGLPGVFIGTILSSLVLWCYSYPKYVYINLFDRKLKNYINETLKHILIFIFITSISFILNKYSNNIITSIIISITIPNIILLIIYKNTEEFKYYKNLIKKLLKKRIRVVK